jgi:membrane protein DedA with SNARE-associated domain
VSVQLALFGIHVPAHLGYIAVGLFVFTESMGVPSPGETAIVTGAVLASQGDLSIELVIVIAIAGAIIGDNLGFLIGRYGGRKLLERPGWGYDRRVRLLAFGDRFFAKHGAKAVFLGRWVALVRVTAAWMAGASGMRMRTFFFWNALGGVTWATAVGIIGYELGHQGGKVISRVGIAGAILGAVAIVAFLVWNRRREKAHLAAAHDPEPEA